MVHFFPDVKAVVFLNGIFGVFNSLASWICSCKKRTCGLWIWNHWFGVMFGIGSIQQFGLFREYVFDLSGTGDATYPKSLSKTKDELNLPGLDCVEAGVGEVATIKKKRANEHPNARKEGHLYFYLKVVSKSSFQTTGVFIIFKRKLSCENSESLNLHHEKWIELASWFKDPCILKREMHTPTKMPRWESPPAFRKRGSKDPCEILCRWMANWWYAPQLVQYYQ